MSLSDVDRQLLQECLSESPQAWRDFVDRFLGLVVHVANHTASARQIRLDHSTRDDLVAEVFLTLVENDFAVLRRFRRHCSLATYLTVISRRVVVRRLVQANRSPITGRAIDEKADPNASAEVNRIADGEQVESLIRRLDDREAAVVRMYHLEGKSYAEIGQHVGLNPNSIGPLLHRVSSKLASS